MLFTENKAKMCLALLILPLLWLTKQLKNISKWIHLRLSIFPKCPVFWFQKVIICRAESSSLYIIFGVWLLWKHQSISYLIVYGAQSWFEFYAHLLILFLIRQIIYSQELIIWWVMVPRPSSKKIILSFQWPRPCHTPPTTASNQAISMTSFIPPAFTRPP